MREFIESLLKTDPFMSNMGEIGIGEIDSGSIELIVPFSEKITRMGGIMHGGAIMSLLDTAGGLSIVTLGNLSNQVTVNLNTTFLRQVSSGPVVIKSRVVKSGKNMAFCQIELKDGKGDICATGTGSWFVYR